MVTVSGLSVVRTLARHALFLGCYLLALSFLRPASLSQKALEEFTVLVEVLDRVGMVGACALHKLAEVVRLALLGLLAHAISHGEQRGVCRSAPILFVHFAPLRGGALILVLTLGLALVPASAKNCSDRLLTGGMVRGDVEQVTGGSGLQTAELVDQGLTGCPGEEHVDDVCINDIRKGVASF